MKDNGGWTLERVNPNHPCSNAENWIASIHATGGTPGAKNSVFDTIPDIDAPYIDSVNVVSLTQLAVFFSEEMDSLSLTNASYTISGASSITEITIPSNFSEVYLNLAPAIDSLSFYTLSILGASDCAGNSLAPDTIIFSKGIVDTVPPQIDSLVVIDGNNLVVYFNEVVDLTTAQILAHYFVNEGIGNPSFAVRDFHDSTIVHLTFADTFLSHQNYVLIINDVEDSQSNVILNSSEPFTYELIVAPEKGNVLFNEIFADPSPAIDLPLAEFVELYNKTNTTFILDNWQFVNSTIMKKIPKATLSPKSYVILCGIKDTALYSPYGNVIGIPSFQP